MRLGERSIPLWKLFLPLGIYLRFFKPELNNPFIPGVAAPKLIPTALTPYQFEQRDINYWLIERLSANFALAYRLPFQQGVDEESVPLNIDWSQEKFEPLGSTRAVSSEREAIRLAGIPDDMIEGD